MIICEDSKILYYDMPKTGSISFEEYLRINHKGRYLPSDAFDHFEESMSIIQKLIRMKHRRLPPEGTDDFIKVATVRNPFDRICSMYFFYVYFRKEMMKLNDQVVLDIILPVDVSSFDNFLDYCVDISERPSVGKFQEQLCYPCSKYMEHENEYHVVRIEYAEEDMKNLPFYNPNHALEHHNKTGHYPTWKDLRTEERRRKIVRWAENDFEKYDYNT